MKIRRYSVYFQKASGWIYQINFHPRKRDVYDYWVSACAAGGDSLCEVMAVDTEGNYWHCPLIRTKYHYLGGRDWRIGDPN